MAFLLPTIATKRANRSVARNLAGASAMFIARTRSTSLWLVTIARRAGEFLPHGGGAAARSGGAFFVPPPPPARPRATAVGRAPRPPGAPRGGKEIGPGPLERAAGGRGGPGHEGWSPAGGRWAPAAGVEPKASSASCASTRRASSRSRARGA